MALDPAILSRDVGFLAKFEEIVLAGESLPAFDSSCPRIIDAARRKLSRAGGYRGITGGRRANTGRITSTGSILNRLTCAIRSGAIHRSRYAQVRRNGNYFRRIGQILADRRRSARRVARRAARRGAIGGSADVIDDVGAGVLVTGYVRFHGIPTEQWEGLVEVGGTGEVGDQQVFQAAVAQPDGDVRERNSRLIRG